MRRGRVFSLVFRRRASERGGKMVFSFPGARSLFFAAFQVRRGFDETRLFLESFGKNLDPKEEVLLTGKRGS
jgi:hypothetical protein